MTQLARTAASSTVLARTQNQRMRLFIITLAVLNIPLILIGLLDLRSSPVTLILTLITSAYYALYYWLVRAGHGVPATYACVVVLVVLLAFGIHNGGGFLTAISSLYFLLLVAVGLVLDDPRALDVTLILCVLSYGALAFVELAFVRPPVFAALYQTTNRLAVGSSVIGMLVTLAGVWRLMRANVQVIHRATGELELARSAAEQRAHENATLADQLQANNATLRDTEARLRETVDALALPLIPLEAGVSLLPLVGYLDEVRAEQMVSGLLEGIHAQHARAVVIDITGLRMVDAQSAAALLRAAHAARLLGARVLLSGIGAEAAQSLVLLDTDLSAIEVVGSLSNALELLAV